MEDTEEVIAEVTERAQAYLDSRRDEASSIVTIDLFRRNINNNRGQKTKVEDINLVDIKVTERQLWTYLINGR